MAIIPAAPTMRVIARDGSKDIWAFDLQTAINRARPGDTVSLSPGRYPKGAVISHGGEKAKPITVRGRKDGTAIFDGGKTREDGRNSGLDRAS